MMKFHHIKLKPSSEYNSEESVKTQSFWRRCFDEIFVNEVM